MRHVTSWILFTGCFRHGGGSHSGTQQGCSMISMHGTLPKALEAYEGWVRAANYCRQQHPYPCGDYIVFADNQCSGLSGAAKGARSQKLMRECDCEVVVWLSGRRFDGKRTEIITITQGYLAAIPVLFNAPITQVYRNKAQWEALKRSGVIQVERLLPRQLQR